MCVCIQDIMDRLLNNIISACLLEEIYTVLYTYDDIAKWMSAMDGEFSFLTFATVVLSMTGLFWRGYSFGFHSNASKEGVLFMICSTILYLSLQLQIMISASTTNELSRKIKSILKNVALQISPKCQALGLILRRNCWQDFTLTLWKIYTVDKALIISTLGTLLTYGMLLGTLGKALSFEKMITVK
ncbi:uncharacterized protein TNIN_142831 [Trichonephila inaurata madagascariensis]|uniref:Uncharacterized protein n=1 Tax=Trichonephila inaurata madagascariensis TaxID=2747483 RepID=A0A8X6XRP2_9ARAC|nr:uncharacterized protein TNIN_142831 [Trichonephila inaurata madagascariensis]